MILSLSFLPPTHSFSFKAKLSLSAILLLGSWLIANAQDREIIELRWSKTIIAEDPETRLSFEGAHYYNEANPLPHFEKRWDLQPNLKVEIEDARFETLNEKELKIINRKLTSDPEITITEVVERKQKGTLLSLLPFRLNPITNKVEKLISFRLKTSPEINSTSLQRPSIRTYTGTSVLASGDWYKIGVLQDGIYKVSYDFLKRLGIETNGLTLQNIRLFGNGGGMLPLLNSVARPDDLNENAIEVVDADNNGSFNEGDYFLFYGQGPDRWTYSTTEKRYNHIKNLFTDTTYYFISMNAAGTAKRINSLPSLTVSENRTVTSFTDYAFHEEDKYNFIKSGRNWFGEIFDVILQQRFTFSFPDLLSGPASIKSSVLARTSINASPAVYSRFDIKYNGSTILSQNLPNVSTSYTSDFGTTNVQYKTFTASTSDVSIDYVFQPYNSSSSGWLDYVSLNVIRKLTLSGDQLFFRDRDSMNVLSQTKYIISNARNGFKLWNITSPTNVAKQEYILNSSVSGGGNEIVFIQNLNSGAQAEYALFDENSYKQPFASGKIPNQNLHALGFSKTDMIIVTAPLFKSEAERLADFRRTNDNLKVEIVTLPEVFNEFSSGAQDVAAIRDFTKMFYDRANITTIPRYLLLFGDGSYDLKDRINGNTNFIPTFQSENSISLIGSYTSDDFYGMMDDIEGTLNGSELMDIGVGRMPVKNNEEARNMVDKVITYSTPGTVSEQTCCAGISTSRLGDWRNVLCFIADDQDNNLHFNQSEDILNGVRNVEPTYNYDQIVCDAYKQESTPGGKRYPEVSDAITKRVEKGALLINYTGHGGEVGWAAEAILDVNMVNGWNNATKLPAFITATCEFSRFDDPLRTSAGELVLLNNKGGGICLFTTVRLAFANDNKYINTKMLDHMFDPINGERPRIGDIERLAKRDYPSDRKLTLLGDPSLQLAYPKYSVKTLSIEETGTGVQIDTLSALSKITIKGKVTDNTGNTLTNFNGTVYPTIFDKSTMVKTLVNDNTGNDVSKLDSFLLRKNILYKGKASIINGEFSSSFIVPRDIAFQYGTGRLSYYAQNATEDANGYDENFIIGGVSTTGINDIHGPEVRLYMNDEKFLYGGLTNSEPSILAILFDSSGINTVGNGIGHDITAQLDGEPQKLYVLNDFYESDLDSYQKGRVIYPLSKLAEGPHTLGFKAWDINNNSTETTTEFTVSSSAKLALDHVLNYPNPFTTHTSFFFEHNKACSGMAVQVQVYTVSGKLVKTLDTYLLNQGFRNTSIDWDGKDDYGDQLGRGVYIYRLKVRDADGETAQKLERLVILR